MRPVERGEVLGLAEYEGIRPRFRARVIEEKKRRRVALGPRMSAVFENRDSVLLQIQEMLRTERITREGAVLHEIATYNDLLPARGELSVTALVEIDDKAEREAFLVRAKGLEAALYVDVDGVRATSRTTPDRLLPDRASAVLYVKFTVGEHGLAVIRAAAAGQAHTVALGVAHPAYDTRVVLPLEVLKSLAED